MIGRRQVKVTEEQARITGRQADIMDHQVEVERAKLRADLYDRRLAVFKACQAYVRETTSVPFDFEASFETAQEISDRLEEAEFLFAGDVRNEIREVSKRADAIVKERIILLQLASSEAKRLMPSSKYYQQKEKIANLANALRDELPGLSQIMGEEMRLYIPRGNSRGDSTPS
ncbi:hypothetical protein [Novosphingobium resinovorum]|uniref:hypothetical protein n=1 Tax=Novosphingobium resinovorum TaxID=158500 RepID=UPI0012E9FEFE|nr:hypothetical protein [Novosphingobium resinovorum]